MYKLTIVENYQMTYEMHHYYSNIKNAIKYYYLELKGAFKTLGCDICDFIDIAESEYTIKDIESYKKFINKFCLCEDPFKINKNKINIASFDYGDKDRIYDYHISLSELILEDEDNSQILSNNWTVNDLNVILIENNLKTNENNLKTFYKINGNSYLQDHLTSEGWRILDHIVKEFIDEFEEV